MVLLLPLLFLPKVACVSYCCCWCCSCGLFFTLGHSAHAHERRTRSPALSRSPPISPQTDTHTHTYAWSACTLFLALSLSLYFVLSRLLSTYVASAWHSVLLLLCTLFALCASLFKWFSIIMYCCYKYAVTHTHTQTHAQRAHAQIQSHFVDAKWVSWWPRHQNKLWLFLHFIKSKNFVAIIYW